MRNLTNYIIEKFKINSNNVSKFSNDMSPEMKSIWDHFEMDKLYTDLSGNDEGPFLTKEEGKEMIEKIEEFLSKNNWEASKFKYFILRGHKFKNNKIAKDFIKNDTAVLYKNTAIDHNRGKDKEILYKKNSLSFEANAAQNLLGMYGPYGGSKIVEFVKD